MYKIFSAGFFLLAFVGHIAMTQLLIVEVKQLTIDPAVNENFELIMLAYAIKAKNEVYFSRFWL